MTSKKASYGRSNIIGSIILKYFFPLILPIILFISNCAQQQQIRRPKLQKVQIPFIRVALDDNVKEGTLTFLNEYHLQSEEATYIIDNTLGEFHVSFSDNILTLKSPDRWFKFENFDKIDFTPVANSTFKWNGISYVGHISLVKSQDQLIIINTLSMTEYLKGVVPYEIPCHSQEYYPAIVTQAISARSYAYYHLHYPSSLHFDVYSDTRDQIYKGLKQNAPLAIKAIEESKGMVLQNGKGEPVETQYHSTCGGTVELKYEVEGIPSEGYFKDIYDDEFNCMTSPLYRWVEKYSSRDILNNLVNIGKLSAEKANSMRENGFTLEIEITSRSNSGRVEMINISLNNMNITLQSYEIRRVFHPSGGNTLPSTLFFIKKSGKYPDIFYLIGAGFGHGKGMCQWGAIGLALKDRSAKEILSFYYPGYILKKIY
jgi:stage II sporulation protein D